MSKKFSYDSEEFHTMLPNDEIPCKTCKFRKDDISFDGKVIVYGYKNGYCKKFNVVGKPNDVLFRNGTCDKYEKE